MPITFDLPVISPISAIPFLVVCIWALFDVITGLIKAFATNSYSSTKMREGLWHKAAIIAVCILAYALEMVTGLMDFSILPGWEQGATIPIVNAVTAYIVVMETGSIIENIVAINPDLCNKQLLKFFGNFSEKLRQEIEAKDKAAEHDNS